MSVPSATVPAASSRVSNRYCHPRRSAATAIVSSFMFDAGTTSLSLLDVNSTSPVRSDSMRTPTRARVKAGEDEQGSEIRLKML